MSSPSSNERTHEREMMQALEERDRYHDYADELARVISEMTGTEIGEHSSMNDPWENALEAGAEFIAKKSSSGETAAPHDIPCPYPGCELPMWTRDHYHATGPDPLRDATKGIEDSSQVNGEPPRINFGDRPMAETHGDPRIDGKPEQDTRSGE